MTSALQRLQANEDDTIWRQNASAIRQLYQEERKTLKEVKTIMENDRGFPVTPLSIWEVKLRGLGMQKKLKSRDWSLVYQHVRPRLQREGKKKLRKPTAILINDTKKSWDEVWREIRRNHALVQRPHRGPLLPLPPGVDIRTPSPDLLKSTIQEFTSQSPQSLILQLFQTTLISLQPLLEVDSQSTVELSDATTYPTSDSVYRMCLQGIPFTILLEKISDTTQRALPSPHTIATLGGSQTNQITSAFRPSSNPTVAGRVTSWESQITSIIAELLPGFGSASQTGQDLDLSFDNHHYLSMVIYLLSNDIIPMPSYSDESEEVTMAEILQMTVKFVSRRLLLTLLLTRLPSIKAAWEKLLLGAQELINEEAFRILITVGMENDWLEEHDKGHEYLFSAARMNCSDILRALIARGCRADSYPSWCVNESVIVEALRNGNPDCAKLLIQHCDVNQEFQAGVFTRHKSTHFAQFILAFDGTRPDHLHCMESFLERGADVDYQIDPFHPLHHPNKRMSWYWNKATVSGLLEDWPLSILDYIYYCHRSLFPKLSKYSGAPSRLSRARALWHLDQDVDTLREYLASDPDFLRLWEQATGYNTSEKDSRERKDHLLEVLFAEQCLLSISDPVDDIWWTRVKGLLVLEIDLTWLSTQGELATSMLQTAAELIASVQETDKEHGSQLMQCFLDKGFKVDADALKTTYSGANFVALDSLASFCDDLKKEGGNVLALAVCNSDFSATKMLLDRGVDISTTFFQEQNMFEHAACRSTFAMMEYVVHRGAQPRTWEEGDHPSHLLSRMLGTTQFDLFKKVQYLVEKYITINEPSCLSTNLLEACISGWSLPEERRMTFEFLWKKGAKLSPGSPLAQWIAYGGGHRLVQEMLDADADPNGCSFDKGITPMQAAAEIGDYTLVCILLDRGADLNGPAFGDYGKTALQAICAWNPVRHEERLRKDKIMTFFLDEGAEVNAPNSRGHTALIYAAQLGDLSSAFRLLKHGAKVNMATSSTGIVWTGTALDTAACNGRLDMVKFLLHANALSSTSDSDGKDYDGAIRLAREGGHFVVSELICKYSADRQRWDVPHGQAIDTRTHPEHTSEKLSLRAKSRTDSWLQSERSFLPSGDLQDVVALDQIDGLSNALEEGMVESSTAACKAMRRGMSGAEATGVSCTRVIGEIEDKSPLADTGYGRSGEEKSDEAGNQVFDTRQASSGPGGWLHQPREQIWVEDEQQNVDPLVSSNLSTDVFMGFSECPSP